MTFHVKKGDTVLVLSGREKGKQGKVLEVLIKKNRVRVENLHMYKKHVKPQSDPANPAGGIVQKSGTVHVSNVMWVNPQTGKPSRKRVNETPAKGVKSKEA